MGSQEPDLQSVVVGCPVWMLGSRLQLTVKAVNTAETLRDSDWMAALLAAGSDWPRPDGDEEERE